MLTNCLVLGVTAPDWSFSSKISFRGDDGKLMAGTAGLGGMVLYLGMSGAAYWLVDMIGMVIVEAAVIMFVVT